jgi:hypothetical protein
MESLRHVSDADLDTRLEVAERAVDSIKTEQDRRKTTAIVLKAMATYEKNKAVAPRPGVERTAWDGWKRLAAEGACATLYVMDHPVDEDGRLRTNATLDFGDGFCGDMDYEIMGRGDHDEETTITFKGWTFNGFCDEPDTTEPPLQFDTTTPDGALNSLFLDFFTSLLCALPSDYSLNGVNGLPDREQDLQRGQKKRVADDGGDKGQPTAKRRKRG